MQYKIFCFVLFRFFPFKQQPCHMKEVLRDPQ